MLSLLLREDYLRRAGRRGSEQVNPILSMLPVVSMLPCLFVELQFREGVRSAAMNEGRTEGKRTRDEKTMIRSHFFSFVTVTTYL
jgi:hypothetical protein